MRFLIALLVAGAVTTSGSLASAAWVKIDDFEDYTADTNLDGQGQWTASTASNAGTVIEDPADSENLVGHFSLIPYSDKGAYADLGANAVADGAVGTIHFRMYRNGASMSIGANNAPFPVAQDGTEGNLAIRYRGQSLYDGTTHRTNLNVTSGSGVWVSYWLVIDNDQDKWTLYQLGNDALTQTLVQAGSISSFDFHHSVGSDSIGYFAVATNQWGNPDQVLFDDIYVDTSGVNLTEASAVPEPATLAVLALGSAGLLAIRRRRAA